MAESKERAATPSSEAGEAIVFDPEGDMSVETQLQRGLKSRHIQFLALGGAIGTGLFIGSGSILHSSGPASLFLSYMCMMALVFFIMNSIAEMVVYLPMKGITMPYFTKRFVDDSLAFAAGWNYWYAYSMLTAAEATAAGIIIDYWKPPVNIGVWIAIVLVVILMLNIIAVSVFGEAEFWFASIKLITIIGLVILGVVIFFGGGPNQKSMRGFSYWKNPGAFTEYEASGSAGHFLAFWHAFIGAGFSFVTSPELIGIAAGECVAPRRNIPKAARRFIFRLAIFYGAASLVIGIMVPYNDSRLLGGHDASASPFVIGIQNVGIEGFDHVINAAVLTSAWSAGNSFLYSGSRVLYSMSKTGHAPAFFRTTTAKGVPYVAILATWFPSILAFLNVSNSGSRVFSWFTNISTISGFVAWIVVLVTYLRFRKAMEYNNMLDVLPYRTRFQPYGTYFVLVVISLLTLTNGFQILIPRNWSFQDFLAAYITLPIFLALYLGHRISTRSKRWAIPIEEVDCITGKKEMDELAEMDQPPVPKNWMEKAWYWLA